MKYGLFFLGMVLGGSAHAGVVDDVKTLFDQAENLEFCLEEAREFVQRVPIYDVFQTIDIVYAFPAIPIVESAYQMLRRADDAPMCDTGCSCQDKACCVACTDNVRLIKSGKVTFYVLLDGEVAERKFSLCSGGQSWRPEEVLSFDDAYRLGILCGGKAERFQKYAYRVVFNTQFMPNRSYTLVVAARHYRVQLCWDGLTGGPCETICAGHCSTPVSCCTCAETRSCADNTCSDQCPDTCSTTRSTQECLCE